MDSLTDELAELDPDSARLCIRIAAIMSEQPIASQQASSETREDYVSAAIMAACTDSCVAPVEGAGHPQLCWIRHMGTEHLSMRCAVCLHGSVISDEDVHAAGRLLGEQYNCALVLTPHRGQLPCVSGGIAHCDVMSVVEMDRGPVVLVCLRRDMQHLLRAAVVTMQAVWRGRTLRDVRNVASPTVTERANAVSAWMGQQMSLLTQVIQDTTEIQERNRDNIQQLQALGSAARAAVHDLRHRMARKLGDWIMIDETPRTSTRRARAARVIADSELTASQRQAVESGLRHVRQGGPLRADILNTGSMAGLTKYQIDRDFGNFTTFRKTVEALQTAPDALRLSEIPHLDEPSSAQDTDEPAQ